MMDQLQPGIYFRTDETPPPCWRLVLLNVASGTRQRAAHDAIAAVVRMLGGLQRGQVRELRGQPREGVEATRATFADLEVLIGFGRSLFDEERHDPPLTQRTRAQFLSYLPAGDEVFPALPWADRESAPGEADLAIQLTATPQAAVNRAAAEVWKLIEDEGLPLQLVASFDGFGRPDGRGWLEFHDGVSNIEPSKRLAAIRASGHPDWMAGGTYMAFLRMLVDLGRWRALDRGDQELVVGRDKLTGNPLVGTRRDSSGRVHPVAARHSDRSQHADPPEVTDPLIESSHLHRANQNRSSPEAPAGFRMFRQGYDFLESLGPGSPSLGLNFVSFQADLGVLHHLLHLPGWLADVNFGGPAKRRRGDPPSPEMISLLAGGLYAVPRRSRPFPGAELFGARQ